MTLEPGLTLAALGMFIGAVIWLVRLEGRVNVSDARWDQMRTDLHEIKEDVKALLHRRP